MPPHIRRDGQVIKATTTVVEPIPIPTTAEHAPASVAVKSDKFVTDTKPILPDTPVAVSAAVTIHQPPPTQTPDEVVDKGSTHYVRTIQKLSSETNHLLDDIKKRLDKLKTPDPKVNQRLEFLQNQLELAAEVNHTSYFIDLRDAGRILKNRVLKMEREEFKTALLSNPDDHPLSVGLFDYLQPAKKIPSVPREPKHPAPPRDTPKPSDDPSSRVGKIIPALVNQFLPDFGIALRPHQWRALAAVDVDWGQAFQNGEDRQGVVIQPTGSGKTHEIFGSIVLGIKQKRIDFAAGDKVVILVDRTDIWGDNIDKLIALFDQFSARLGFPTPTITQIAGQDYKVSDSKNYRGQIIVAMVPTVGLEENSKIFTTKLRSALGTGRVALGIVDEYDKSVTAPTWARARNALSQLAGEEGYYELGLTATLPSHARPKANILMEESAVGAMREDIIPTADLLEIPTGISLDTIPVVVRPDGSVDFKEDDLARTVRNQTRDRLIWQTHEAHALRDDQGNIKPTLVRGVTIAHASELLRGYQVFQKSSSHPKNSVVLENPTREELEKYLIAKQTGSLVDIPQFIFTGDQLSANHLLRYESGGTLPKTKVDTIAVLITGDTDPEVRNKIDEAGVKGLINVVGIIGVWKRGKDLPWIKNHMDTGATLSEVDKEQYRGRSSRYGPDEVNAQGKLLKEEPRRYFDFIDFRSGSQMIQTFAHVAGLGKSPEPGRAVNLRTGHKKKLAGFAPTDPAPPTLPEPETTHIKGDREHLLIVGDSLTGPQLAYAKELRLILDGDLYQDDLSSMAGDLAVSEENLVGMLNALVPTESRIALRMATFLYEQRKRLAEKLNESIVSANRWDDAQWGFRPVLFEITRENYNEKSRSIIKLKPVTGRGGKPYFFPKNLSQMVYELGDNHNWDVSKTAQSLGLSLQDLNQMLAGKLPLKPSQVETLGLKLGDTQQVLLKAWWKDILLGLNTIYPFAGNVKPAIRRYIQAFRVAIILLGQEEDKSFSNILVDHQVEGHYSSIRSFFNGLKNHPGSHTYFHWKNFTRTRQLIEVALRKYGHASFNLVFGTDFDLNALLATAVQIARNHNSDKMFERDGINYAAYLPDDKRVEIDPDEMPSLAESAYETRIHQLFWDQLQTELKSELMSIMAGGNGPEILLEAVALEANGHDLEKKYGYTNALMYLVIERGARILCTWDATTGKPTNQFRPAIARFFVQNGIDNPVWVPPRLEWESAPGPVPSLDVLAKAYNRQTDLEKLRLDRQRARERFLRRKETIEEGHFAAIRNSVESGDIDPLLKRILAGSTSILRHLVVLHRAAVSADLRQALANLLQNIVDNFSDKQNSLTAQQKTILQHFTGGRTDFWFTVRKQTSLTPAKMEILTAEPNIFETTEVRIRDGVASQHFPTKRWPDWIKVWYDPAIVNPVRDFLRVQPKSFTPDDSLISDDPNQIQLASDDLDPEVLQMKTDDGSVDTALNPALVLMPASPITIPGSVGALK